MRYKVAVCLLSMVISPAAMNASGVKIDPVTGLIIDASGKWEITRNNCISCHSSKLIIQNHMDRDNWLNTIKLMQDEHGLWPLDNREELILDYLSEFYGIRKNTNPKSRSLPVTE